MRTETLSIFDLLDMILDNETAERWLESKRWPDGQRYCPDCGSGNHQVVSSRTPMPYRCRDCRAYFSVRKGTCMQSSKLSHRTWVLAIYLVEQHPKGYSRCQLAKDLGIPQKTAWSLAHLRAPHRPARHPHQRLHDRRLGAAPPRPARPRRHAHRQRGPRRQPRRLRRHLQAPLHHRMGINYRATMRSERLHSLVTR